MVGWGSCSRSATRSTWPAPSMALLDDGHVVRRSRGGPRSRCSATTGVRSWRDIEAVYAAVVAAIPGGAG